MQLANRIRKLHNNIDTGAHRAAAVRDECRRRLTNVGASAIFSITPLDVMGAGESIASAGAGGPQLQQPRATEEWAGSVTRGLGSPPPRTVTVSAAPTVRCANPLQAIPPAYSPC